MGTVGGVHVRKIHIHGVRLGYREGVEYGHGSPINLHGML